MNYYFGLICNVRSLLLLSKEETDSKKVTNENSNFECNIDRCQKNFVDETAFRQHQFDKHHVGGNYPCTVKGCDRIFWAQHHYRQHLEEHAHGIPSVRKLISSMIFSNKLRL